MKRLALMTSLALLLSVAAIALVIVPNGANRMPWAPAYKIIIVAGQSNAVGRAPIIPEWQVDSTGIYQLGRFGDTNLTVIPAREPLAHWDASGAAFALTAVNLLHQSEPGDYLIIPAAMGASGFADHMWTAGTGPLYVDLIERTRAVLDRYPRSSIRAVFWHGGETEWEEAEEGYNELYPEQMAAMVAQLWSDLPMDGVPFLMGGVVPSWAALQTPNPNEVLRAVAADIGACYVSSEGLLPLHDGVHFELGSQQALGRRYFDALMAGCPRSSQAEPAIALR